jgi:transmembrane sensor
MSTPKHPEANAAPLQDPVWQAAWHWVLREHEGRLDDAQRAERLAWLNADPAHRKAYDEAARLWLLAGLVPPAHVQPPVDGDEDVTASPRG